MQIHLKIISKLNNHSDRYRICIFILILFLNSLNAQIVDPWIYVAGGYVNIPNITAFALQKVNVNSNELITVSEHIGTTDIAFHPNGKMYGCYSSQIIEIDTSSFNFPSLPVSTIFIGDIQKCYFAGMTIDKNGLIWLIGHNKVNRTIFTYDLINNELKEVAYFPWIKSYVDVEWFNGELYAIGLEKLLDPNAEIMLVKINLEDAELSTEYLLGKNYESWGLASVNDECKSYKLIGDLWSK